MRNLSYSVNQRVTHLHVWRSHIYLGSQNIAPVGIFTSLHLSKHLKILFHRPVTIWTFLTWFFHRAAILSNLLFTECAYICFSCFDEMFSIFIKLFEIIRSVVEPIFPIEAEPVDIFFD